MEENLVILAFIIFLSFTFHLINCNNTSTLNDTEHENSNSDTVENICIDRCICFKAIDEVNVTHLVLSCSLKNFSSVLQKWPERFGNDMTGSELVVSFSGNTIPKLKQLPTTSASLSFSCRHCEIHEIEYAAFMNTTNISRLDLSFNRLKSDALVPDVFRGQYSNERYNPLALEDLDLSHNQISTLDGKLFEHTPGLKRLRIASNQLGSSLDTSTIQAIASAKELRYLDLSFNGLRILSNKLFKNGAITEELNLQGNKFMTVPESLSLIGKTLRNFYIGDNPIKMLNEESFLDLKEIIYLNLSGMKNLEEIRVGTFAVMTNLEYLICRDNPHLYSFDLGGLKQSAANMKELDLTNCHLRDFNTDYNWKNFSKDDQKWNELKILRLEGNPWHCDCNLYNVLKELRSGGDNQSELYDKDNSRCYTPYELSAIRLNEIDEDRVCEKSLPLKNKETLSDVIWVEKNRSDSAVLTVITLLAIAAIGTVVGFTIVVIKRKLKQRDPGFIMPIRYSTVRHSSIDEQ